MTASPSSRERSLKRLQARIRICTKDVDAGYLERARPVVAGSIRDRIAIVGQCTGCGRIDDGIAVWLGLSGGTTQGAWATEHAVIAGVLGLTWGSATSPDARRVLEENRLLGSVG